MKKIITATDAPKAIGPYSQAIEANNTLYISGQLGIDPVTGKMVEGGVKEQAEQALKNIGAILRTAGCSYGDVVKTSCYLADMELFKDFNEVYARFYTLDPPARSTFAVKGLPLGALVEIETIAVKG